MEFFVGIENTDYCAWQIELLLESFHQHQIQDRLLVTNVASQTKPSQNFNFHLSKHKRIYNIQKSKLDSKYSRLTVLLALYNSLKYNLIHQPFIYLQPSVVVSKPELVKEFKFDGDILYSPDEHFNLEHYKQQIPGFINYFSHVNNINPSLFLKLGGVIVFQNAPLSFFQNAIHICKKLIQIQIKSKQEVYEHTDKLALSLAVIQDLNKLKLSSLSLCTHLMSNSDNVFLDYERGMPPMFVKSMFQFKPPLFASCGHPYEVINEHNPTATSLYLAKLARNLLKKQPA
jgi:hypothetical protein